MAAQPKKPTTRRQAAAKTSSSGARRTLPATTAGQPFPVVGIGSSAADLEALQQLFTHMPADSGAAFVIVQHLDPTHKGMMAEILKKYTAMPVLQVEDGMQVAPDHVYLIPPNTLLTIQRGALRLAPPKAPREHRVPIDMFLRSLGQDQGDQAVCIILSGTGSDGAVGLKLIKERGGMTMAQSDAMYDGLPYHAIATGLVDYAVPVADIPVKLLTYLNHRTSLEQAIGAGELGDETANHFDDLLAVLLASTGNDFSLYKRRTLVRRIQRRMQVLACDTLPAYIAHLRQDTAEVEALCKELLIGVSHFFRDPEAFDVLAKQAIVKLCESKAGDDPLRIWVPGCATGEEAYSIALILKEYMTQTKRQLSVQIFATDLDTRTLEIARVGSYPEGIAADVSAERLRQFFVQHAYTYQIDNSIRGMCIFSPHNLLKDPPFSKLDLISCRNVLTYLQSELQQRLLPRFHYALKPGRFLFLGSSEAALGASDLFTPVDRKSRLFRRRQGMARPEIDFSPLIAPRQTEADSSDTSPKAIGETNLAQVADRIILADYAPAYVIINEKGEVVYTSARTGPYLELPRGEPAINVISMARAEIRRELRTAMRQALRQRQIIVNENVQLHLNDRLQRLRLTIRQLPELGADAGLMMVLFEAIAAPTATAAAEPAQLSADPTNPVVQQLEAELKRTRANLQATTEKVENANEELASSNEELMSMNEEFQSITEELRTSEEDLQSSNAELGTVNSELQHKIDALTQANNDIQNFLDSTHIAVIFLDKRYRIKSFTPMIRPIFHLIEGDIGRPITDMASCLAYDQLKRDIDTVLYTLLPIEQQLQTADGSWYIMRIRPYRTLDNVIDGVVITFVDVTALKRAEAEIAQLNQLNQRRVSELETILDVAPIGIAITDDPDCRHIRINRRGYDILGVPPGSNLAEYQPGRAQAAYQVFSHGREKRLDELTLRRAARTGEPIRGEESVIVRQDGKTVNVTVAATPLRNDQGEVVGAVATFGNITLLKQAQQEAEMHAKQQAVVARLGLRALADEDVKAVMDEAVEVVAQTLEVTYCQVLELHPDGLLLHLQAGVGWQEGLVGKATVLADINSQAGFTLLSNAPVVVEDLRTETRFKGPPLLLEHGVVSGMSVIIHGRNRPYGVLGVHTTQRRIFTSYDIAFLQSVANVLTTALHRAHIQAEGLRAQLHRNERLASIGTLAAGIAHEMNNPLNTILINAEYARSLQDANVALASDDMQAALQDIAQEAQRCGDIVRNLLRFAREEPTEKAPHDLNEVIQRVVNLADHYLTNTSLAIRCDLSPYLPLVLINPTEIEQVLVNLLQNAADAEPQGVQVTIQTVSDQDTVQVIVRDNGPGIAAGQVGHIFDPFYSTRRQYGGTGLGLSIIYSIITAHQGTIQVDSTVGEGTTFRITLPSAAEGAGGARPEFLS